MDRVDLAFVLALTALVCSLLTMLFMAFRP